ncbi:MAG: Rrf2 family transcriptional regulator, partial [Clostridia bacterium]|nr:Rrf2 family transcriptional regulator [Clostridia bacterium]
MKLSTRARYGLRLCFLIGVAGEKTSLPTLVKQTDLSEKYLEQLLAMLRKGGVVESVRGAGGGYYLSKSADQTTIKEILVALDDGFEMTDCISGKCQDEYCPNKIIFRRLYDGIDS